MINSLVVFSNDLRLDDHPIIDHLYKTNPHFVPVYLDFFELIPSLEFFPINVSKRKLRLSMVDHLEKLLLAKGKRLKVIKQNFRESLLDTIERNNCKRILLSRHTISPLADVIASLELVLLKNNIFVEYFDSNYLLDLDDMPFPLTRVPSDFKSFAHHIKRVRHRQADESFDIPLMVQSVMDEIKKEETPVLLPYKTRLNNHFSKFLPFLSSGMISPAQLLFFVENHLEAGTLFDLKALKVLESQLIKLDFIRIQMRNQTMDLFEEVDLTDKQVGLIEQWIEGNTEDELINAIMHQLKNTSMISLTAKRLAILYYLKVLQLPGYFGFHYFDSQLHEWDTSLNRYFWHSFEHSHISADEVLVEISHQLPMLDPEHSFVDFWN